MINALSPVSTIERIAAIESELAQLRVEAYSRAGIPLPSQCKRIARLVELAATVFGVSEAAITGANRARKICRPRFAVMWSAREAFGHSTTTIGRAMGDRDHTSVINAISRAEEWREGDSDFREITDQLVAMVTPKKEAADETRH